MGRTTRHTAAAVLTLCLAIATLIIGPAAPVAHAATDMASPPARPIARAVAQTDGALVLQRLGLRAQEMRGPYASQALQFALPAQWQLTGAAQLDLTYELRFAPSAAAAASAQSASDKTIGPVLRVLLNGQAVSEVPLTKAGKQSVKVALKADMFGDPAKAAANVIAFEVDDRLACSDRALVTIAPESTLTFSKRNADIEPKLAMLPWPLVQPYPAQAQTLVVIPDAPTPSEMQAALNIVAGLGRVSQGSQDVRLVSIGTLTKEQRASANLIIVGQPGTQPLVKELRLPLPLTDSGFEGASASDGIVQVMASPSNGALAILVVTGASDDAVVKAARAVSAGAITPTNGNNVALISDVGTAKANAPVEATDFRLADLGFAEQRIAGVGTGFARFSFDLPAGKAVKTGAYLDLAYAHSAQMNYERSGITVIANGVYVGALKLSDNSLQLSVDRVALPPTALIEGRNDLLIQADLAPINQCGAGASNLWLTAYPDTALHIPTEDKSATVAPRLQLATYPALFAAQTDLSNVIMVMPQGDAASWSEAARIAFDLGQRSAARPLNMLARFDTDVPQDLRANRDMIVIGKASETAFLSQLKADAPAAIPGDSNADVKYKFANPPDVGFLQVSKSPWAAGRVVLVMLGSTDAGLKQALDALMQSAQRAQLTGNAAVVENGAITTANTDTVPIKEGSAVVTPVPSAAVPLPSNVPSWVIPAIVAAVLAIIGIFAGAIVVGIRRRAARPVGE